MGGYGGSPYPTFAGMGGGPYQPQAPAVDLNSLQNAIAQSQQQAQPPQPGNGMTPDKVAQAYHAALAQVLRGRGRKRSESGGPRYLGPPTKQPPQPGPNYLGPPIRG